MTRSDVSVVIPCYNQGRFLRDAIQSALAQTAGPPEIVVVDDGSTDSTGDVARSFPEVRYVRQRNRGRCAARNAGASASTGRHVVFLDADDVLLPDAIDAGLAAFDLHPECAFVYGYCLEMDDAGAHESFDTDKARRTFFVDRDFYRALLRHCFIWCPAMVLFRRDVVERYPFREELEVAEDHELYLRIARDLPIFCHQRFVALYREHAAATTGNARKMLVGSVAVLKSQRPFVARDSDLLADYRAGIRYRGELYGKAVVHDVRGALRGRRSMSRIPGDLVAVVRHAPHVLGQMVLTRVRRVLSGRRRNDPVDEA